MKIIITILGGWKIGQLLLGPGTSMIMADTHLFGDCAEGSLFKTTKQPMPGEKNLLVHDRDFNPRPSDQGSYENLPLGHHS